MEKALNTTEEPRVWFIAPFFGKTSCIWMHRQANEMRRVSVIFLARHQHNPDAYPPTGCTLHLIPEKVTVPLTFENRFLRIAERHIRSMRNWRFAAFSASNAELRWLMKRFDADQPQVAICHYGTTAVHYMPVLKKFGIPTVVHFNGADLSRSVNDANYVRSLVKILPQVDTLVVVAEYMRDWLVSHGAEPERIRYIPYGVPLHLFRPSTEVGANPCRFLAVGNLVHKKAPIVTLRAFAKCRDACRDAKLTVIGDGVLREDCERLLTDLQLHDSVDMLGAQPTQRVQEEMERASVFVQHSITDEDGDKEGWPVAVGEAAASGLPIVATRHASIPEQVKDGVSGLLVEENDCEGMAAAMISLARDVELRGRMGAAARIHISQWDLRTQLDELERVLLEVATGVGAAARRGT